MGADNPRISVGALDDGLYVHVRGRPTQRICPTVARIVDDYLSEVAGTPRITIDLGGSAWVDSTFAGWLAGLSKRVSRTNGGKLVLAGCGDRCRGSLERMHLDGLFCFCEERDLADVRELPCATGDRPDKAAIKLMLEAHQELMAASESNARVFAPIVAALKRQLEAT